MRQNKQKRQKHELIFKYVRALTPYNQNPQASKILQQLSARKDAPTPNSILASSKTGDSPTKSKKRVQFSDDVVMHSTQGKSNSQNGSPEVSRFQANSEASPSKKDRINAGERGRLRDSPESIHRDLEALQRSVFSTFQIKEQPTLVNYPPPLYSLTARNTYSHSTRALPVPPTTLSPQPTRSPNLVSRAKSAVTLPTNHPLNLRDKRPISSSSSSIQTSRQTLKPSRPQSLIRSINSRALSQQQANLMVQIFKQRLQMQGGK